MNEFNLKITTFVDKNRFNLKIQETLDTCVDASYYFNFIDMPPTIQEGQVVDISVQGGIGPFTWTMISAGSAFTDATTTGKQNELTCTTLPTSGHLQFSVEDSCGTEITGELVPLDYDPGEGCTSGEPPLPLVLTGDNTPVVGDVYTASEGTPPYAFSFDKGTISVTADTCTILTIDACSTSGTSRVGIISVQDSKLDEASIHGLLPGGEWVYIDFECYSGSGGTDEAAYLCANCCVDTDSEGYDWQRVHFTDGTSDPVIFIIGDGKGYKEYVNTIMVASSVCPSYCDSCGYCGTGSEDADAEACVRSNRAVMTAYTSSLTWDNGDMTRTPDNLVYTDTNRYMTYIKYNYEWQCP